MGLRTGHSWSDSICCVIYRFHWPQVLGWKYNGHNTSTCVDAVTVAGYFGLNRSLTSEQIVSMSITDLFNNMETQGRAEWREQMERQITVSKQYGVGMVGYEGGQSS